MTTVAISQPMLFPWTGMYELYSLADIFVHYDDVPFSRGSFVNRVQLKSPGGTTWMSIPLQRPASGVPICELRANDHIPWRENHLNQLRENYREAPHADVAVALARDVYESDHDSLSGLIIDAFESVARYLGLERPGHRSSKLGLTGSKAERVLNHLEHFSARRYVSALGGLKYLPHEEFDERNIRVEYMKYSLTEYPQLHGKFTPYVSTLDLIANVGPAARQYINPRATYWKEITEHG